MNIYPVIHYLDHHTAIEQAAIVKASGADGTFLISHHGNDDELVGVARDIKQIHPDLAIGINLLSKSPLTAAYMAANAGLDMVWADDMGVDSTGLTDVGLRLSVFARQRSTLRCFASVAFKYRATEANPALAAWNAQQAGFIPTTSGAATGSAPDLDKIAAMSAATEGQLAVASGMDPANVTTYAPYLSHILVATGISVDAYRIHPGRLQQLIARAKPRQKALS